MYIISERHEIDLIIIELLYKLVIYSTRVENMRTKKIVKGIDNGIGNNPLTLNQRPVYWNSLKSSLRKILNKIIFKKESILGKCAYLK